jgi:phytoene synthase
MTMETTDIAPLQMQPVAVKSSFYLAMRILEPARRDAM